MNFQFAEDDAPQTEPQLEKATVGGIKKAIA